MPDKEPVREPGKVDDDREKADEQPRLGPFRLMDSNSSTARRAAVARGLNIGVGPDDVDPSATIAPDYRWDPTRPGEVLVANHQPHLRARVARAAYGDPRQMQYLSPFSRDGHRYYRLETAILQPEWRSIAQQRRASGRSARLAFGGPARRGTVILVVPPGPRSSKPNSVDAYDPRLQYGQPVGTLWRILEQPEDYRHQLDKAPDHKLVVRIEHHTLLAARRMTYATHNNQRVPYNQVVGKDTSPTPVGLPKLLRLLNRDRAAPKRRGLGAPFIIDPLGRDRQLTHPGYTLLGGNRTRGVAPSGPLRVWDGRTLFPMAHRPNLLDLLRPPAQRPNTDGQVMSYRVMSVAELRDMVRRHGTQRRLARAGKTSRRLVNLTASNRFVTGTHGDMHAFADTGEHDTVTTDPETKAPGKSRGEATPEATLDKFDIALAKLPDLRSRHPGCADLIDSLIERLTKLQIQLSQSPDKATEYNRLIDVHLDVAAMCSRVLVRFPALLARYKDRDPLVSELGAIQNLYVLALSFSDQTATSLELYSEANERMTTFPLLELRSSAGRMDEGIKRVAGHKGSDPWFKDLGIERGRANMKAASTGNQKLDYASLQRALTDAKAAAKRGDHAAAKRHTQIARFHQKQMEGRYRLTSQLHQSLLTFQHLAHSSARVTHIFTNKDQRLIALIRRLHALLMEYEGNPSPESRADVLGRLDALWESDEAYKKFYRGIYDFIETSDFAVHVAIIVGAGLLSMGAGAAVGGAIGATTTAAGAAAKFGGVLVAETLAFTAASRAGEGALIGHGGANEGINGVDTKQRGFGEDFAWNLGMFLLLRGVGSVWGSLAKDMSTAGRVVGQMATGYAALEAFAVAQLGWEKGRLPTAEEFASMSIDNAIIMLVMHGAGHLAKPTLSRIEGKAAEIVRADYGPSMKALEARRVSVSGDLAKVLETAKATKQPPDMRKLGKILRDAKALETQFKELLLRATQNRRANPEQKKALRTANADQSARVADMAQLQLAIEIGLRPMPDGTSALFNNGQAGRVENHFRDQGRTVHVRELPDGRTLLEVGAGHNKLLLIESRGTANADLLRGWREGRTVASELAGDVPAGLDPKAIVVGKGESPPADRPYYTEAELNTVRAALKQLRSLENARAKASADTEIEVLLTEDATFAVVKNGKGWLVKLGRHSAEMKDPRMLTARVVHERTHAAQDKADPQRKRSWQARETEAYRAELDTLRELTGGNLAEFAELVHQRFGRESFAKLMKAFGERYAELIAKEKYPVEKARAEAYQHAWLVFESKILPDLAVAKGKSYAEHYGDPKAEPRGEVGASKRDSGPIVHKTYFGKYTPEKFKATLEATRSEFLDALPKRERAMATALLESGLGAEVDWRALILSMHGKHLPMLEGIPKAVSDGKRSSAEAGDLLRDLANEANRNSSGGGMKSIVSWRVPQWVKGKHKASRTLAIERSGLTRAQYERVERFLHEPRLLNRRYKGQTLDAERLSKMNDEQLAQLDRTLNEADLLKVEFWGTDVDLAAITTEYVGWHGAPASPAAVEAKGGFVNRTGVHLDAHTHKWSPSEKSPFFGMSPEAIMEFTPDTRGAHGGAGSSNDAMARRPVQGGPVQFAGHGGYVYKVDGVSGINQATAQKHFRQKTEGGLALGMDKPIGGEKETSALAIPWERIRGWRRVSKVGETYTLGEYEKNPDYAGRD